VAKHYFYSLKPWERRSERYAGARLESIEARAEEGRPVDPPDDCTPEQYFDLRLSLGIFQLALARVRDDYEKSGPGADDGRPRARLFETLARCVVGAEDRPHQDIARELGTTVEAFDTALSRFRDRVYEACCDVIAPTVSTPVEVEEELRFIISLLRTRRTGRAKK
jgi:hypothetical protein